MHLFVLVAPRRFSSCTRANQRKRLRWNGFWGQGKQREQADSRSPFDFLISGSVLVSHAMAAHELIHTVNDGPRLFTGIPSIPEYLQRLEVRPPTTLFTWSPIPRPVRGLRMGYVTSKEPNPLGQLNDENFRRFRRKFETVSIFQRLFRWFSDLQALISRRTISWSCETVFQLFLTEIFPSVLVLALWTVTALHAELSYRHFTFIRCVNHDVDIFNSRGK